MEVDLGSGIRRMADLHVEPLCAGLDLQVSHNCRAAPAEGQPSVLYACERSPEEPSVDRSKVVTRSESNCLRTRYSRLRAIEFDSFASHPGGGCRKCERRSGLGFESKLRVGTSL